jgi:hypothetical protein
MLDGWRYILTHPALRVARFGQHKVLLTAGALRAPPSPL